MAVKSFVAKTDNLNQVLEFLEDELMSHGCNQKVIISLSVAIEELFVNVASYAYPSGDGTVDFSINFEDNDVLFELSDKGIPFNPLEKEDPDITLNAEERQIGGLGIYMVKKTMDDMKYQRKDNMNILSMRKRIKN